MKIVALSDIHGQLPNPITCPKCDVIVIAGDICPDRDPYWQLHWLYTEFRQWLKDLPAQVVGIAGNHDFVFEVAGEQAKNFGNETLPWTYLQDSEVTIDGVKFYGIPWVPRLEAWAFYQDDLGLAERYSQIPVDTNVLISHGPPLSVLDSTKYYSHVGSQAALEAIKYVNPQLFICGHIHEGRGYRGILHTEVWNVASLDERYAPYENRWVEIDLDTDDLNTDALSEEQESTDIVSGVQDAPTDDGLSGQQSEGHEPGSS
jgi:Icc-related predicted phosphoesterase